MILYLWRSDVYNKSCGLILLLDLCNRWGSVTTQSSVSCWKAHSLQVHSKKSLGNNISADLILQKIFTELSSVTWKKRISYKSLRTREKNKLLQETDNSDWLFWNFKERPSESFLTWDCLPEVSQWEWTFHLENEHSTCWLYLCN